jgi:hypothetical protein
MKFAQLFGLGDEAKRREKRGEFVFDEEDEHTAGKNA